MQLKIYKNGILRSNSYALINSQNQAILIDAGSHFEFYKEQEQEDGFKIKYVLLTHGHFDHITAGAKLQANGAQIAISSGDEKFTYTKANLATNAGFAQTPFKCDFTVEDNQILELCGFKIKVIATPGHTAGSVCFLIDDMLFSGDTLFQGSIGRTDFPTGSYDDIISSIKNKLFLLSEKTKVYPGHENQSTIELEKKYNPYFNEND